MAGVTPSDMRRLADLLDELREHRAVALSVLVDRLPAVIPADFAVITRANREPGVVIALDGGTGVAEARNADRDGWDALLDQHPIVVWRAATGSDDAAAISDLVSATQFRSTEIYARFFAPYRFEDGLSIRLPGVGGLYTDVAIGRDRRGFNERDRLMLGLLQRYLSLLWARDATLPAAAEPDSPLSPREREILALVGEGSNNTQIAAQLFISPGTVKKHLDNVFLKLGVHSRAAAVAMTISDSRTTPHDEWAVHPRSLA